MTTLKIIFSKPVDRPIEGVIKADDEAGLRLEIVVDQRQKDLLEVPIDRWELA